MQSVLQNHLSQVNSQIESFQFALKQFENDPNCNNFGFRPSISLSQYLHTMVNKYVEVPPVSSGIFLTLTLLEIMSKFESDLQSNDTKISEKDMYTTFVGLCKELPIKLNGKTGISGLSFDLTSVCDLLQIFQCIDPSVSNDASNSAPSASLLETKISVGSDMEALQACATGGSTTHSSSMDNKRYVTMIVNSLRNKWGDYLNKYIKGQKDLITKRLVSAVGMPIPSPTVGTETGGIEGEGPVPTSVPTSDVVSVLSNHSGQGDVKDNAAGQTECLKTNYRSWDLLSSVNAGNSSYRRELITNPRNAYQELHKAVYLEQYALETEECLMRRILGQCDMSMNVTKTVVSSSSSTDGKALTSGCLRLGSRYLSPEYRYRPPPRPAPPVVEIENNKTNLHIVVPSSSSSEAKYKRKEKILAIVNGSPSVKAVDNERSSSTISSGLGMFQKSFSNGTVFSAQMLIDKARKLAKFRENNPLDMSTLSKQYEEAYERASNARAASTPGHTPKLHKKPKLAAANLVLDPHLSTLVKKRRNHQLLPCSINMHEGVQVNPTGNEYLLYANSYTSVLQNIAANSNTSNPIHRSSSNTSEPAHKMMKKSNSMGNISAIPSFPGGSVHGTNGAAMSSMLQSYSAGTVVHPGHILLPDLVIRTTEIPWSFIAKEFSTLDHNEEHGDYSTMKRSASIVDFGPDANGSAMELVDSSHPGSGLDAPPLERKLSGRKRRFSDALDPDLERSGSGIDPVKLLESPSHGLDPLRRHVSIVLAPKYEAIPPTMFKKYPKNVVPSGEVGGEAYSIGNVDISSEEEEEDISDENMLAKHDAVLANMREKWVTFASYKKSHTASSPNNVLNKSTSQLGGSQKMKKRTLSNLSYKAGYVSPSKNGMSKDVSCNSIASLSSTRSTSEPSNSPLASHTDMGILAAVTKKPRGRPVKSISK